MQSSNSGKSKYLDELVVVANFVTATLF